MSDKTKFEVGKLYITKHEDKIVVRCDNYFNKSDRFTGTVVLTSSHRYRVGHKTNNWLCSSFKEYGTQLDINSQYTVPQGYNIKSDNGRVVFTPVISYTKYNYNGSVRYYRKYADKCICVQIGSGDMVQIDDTYEPLSEPSTKEEFDEAYSTVMQKLTYK